MLFILLLKTVAGSDGTLFRETSTLWVRLDNGIPTVRYQRKTGHYLLRLKPEHYQVLICDPDYQEEFGTAFERKNVKEGG